MCVDDVVAGVGGPDVTGVGHHRRGCNGSRVRDEAGGGSCPGRLTAQQTGAVR